MTANLVVIFGPPASGKAAIGHELAKLTDYRFFHNHLTTDPVAALFGWDSEQFQPTVEAVRDLLLSAAAASPEIPGVIFTFMWAFNVENDGRFIEEVAAMFAAGGGEVLFVELLASEKARLAREGTPFRVKTKPAHRDVPAARARHKDFNENYRMNTDGALPLPYSHIILDTEALKPKAAANRIKEAMMPFKSKAQRRKFAQLLVEGKIKPETFEEWNRETGKKKLPERVKKKKSTKRR